FRFDRPLPVSGHIMGLFGTLLYRIARLASGSFLFCTRETFEAVGGFGEDLFAGEELAMSRAIRRVGRFVVLRESVTTSGRNIRAYTGREKLVSGWKSRSGKSRRTREGKEIWYDPRRADPADG